MGITINTQTLDEILEENNLLKKVLKVYIDDNERIHKMTSTFNEFISKETEKLIHKLCSWCGEGASFYWNIENNNYQAFCPHCGSVLMLCSECDTRNNCDWNETKERCCKSW